MKKFMFVALAMIFALSAFSVPSVLAAPEPPVDTTRVLAADLSGPAIDGVVPSGKAEFVASQGGTSLDVGMFNLLNLADGTCLDIAFGRTVFQGVPVRNGGASFSISPSPEIHVGEDITIAIGEPPADQTSCLGTLGGGVLAPATGTVILSGTFQQGSGTK